MIWTNKTFLHMESQQSLLCIFLLHFKIELVDLCLITNNNVVQKYHLAFLKGLGKFQLFFGHQCFGIIFDTFLISVFNQDFPLSLLFDVDNQSVSSVLLTFEDFISSVLWWLTLLLAPVTNYSILRKTLPICKLLLSSSLHYSHNMH